MPAIVYRDALREAEKSHAQRLNKQYFFRGGFREQLKRSVEFTLRKMGETPEEQTEAEKVLKEMRADRNGIMAKIAELVLRQSPRFGLA